MSKKLKVFSCIIFVDGKQCDCVMATTSQKKFMAVTRAQRGYFSITGNKDQVAIALSKPEQAFYNTKGMKRPAVFKEYCE